MRATVMYGAGDVRVETVPDARIVEPTDALITVTRACICGSDLWPYNLKAADAAPQSMGHEAIGIVEAVGADVRTLKPGDLVVMPFAFSDGTCAFCHEGLHTACVHGGFFGSNGLNGAQAEALRVPQADGTLFVLPVGQDDALMPSLLTLSDVMGTGHHAAVDRPGAPRRLGRGARRRRGRPLRGDRREAARARSRSSCSAGTTTASRWRRSSARPTSSASAGAAAIERVRALTGGFGAHSVLECVGTGQAIETAVGIVRKGGAIGRVGVPHYEAVPAAAPTFYGNITVSGGPAPVRAYIEELLPDVMEGVIEPGRVFDRVVGLDEVPDGYRAMNDRESIKVMVKP